MILSKVESKDSIFVSIGMRAAATECLGECLKYQPLLVGPSRRIAGGRVLYRNPLDLMTVYIGIAVHNILTLRRITRIWILFVFDEARVCSCRIWYSSISMAYGQYKQLHGHPLSIVINRREYNDFYLLFDPDDDWS